MAKIPVVFAFDKRIVLGAAVAIKSLIDYANPETSYDIRVLHSDIDNKTIKEFEKITKNTDHNIKFHYINPDKFAGLPKSKGSWTEIVYYRIIIPEILTEYDKVIYSDVDVLFTDDMYDVYNTDLEEFEWGGVRAEINSENTICHKYFPENKNEYIFWSGFMLINCKRMRENQYFEKLKCTAKNMYERLQFFDLDLLNISCDNIKSLPLKYCLLGAFHEYENLSDVEDYKYLKDIYSDEEINEAKQHPAIIHYAGYPGKPWRRRHVPANYKEYMDKKIPKSLRRFTFRDLRKRLFSKI